MQCPYCARDQGENAHGTCQYCGEHCGCSFNPTSDSDYCDEHRPNWTSAGVKRRFRKPCEIHGLVNCKSKRCKEIIAAKHESTPIKRSPQDIRSDLRAIMLQIGLDQLLIFTTQVLMEDYSGDIKR